MSIFTKDLNEKCNNILLFLVLFSGPCNLSRHYNFILNQLSYFTEIKGVY